MISFIVTSYNLEDWLLRRCLQSIIDQAFSKNEYEIIVVDDGSDVSPQKVIDEFTTEPIQLYIQAHQRQGAARNLGLKKARGKWIQFVDGDDYLFAGTMMPLVTLMQADELDVMLYAYQETTAKERETATQATLGYTLYKTGNLYMADHQLFGSCCTLLFRRNLCVEKEQLVLPFTENIFIEDEEFVSKLVWKAGRTGISSEIAYAYYRRENSTTHKTDEEHILELFRNYFTVLDHLMEYRTSHATFPNEGLQRKITFLAVDILRRALRTGNWEERFSFCQNELKKRGLFPFPKACYGLKHRVFRRMSDCSIGVRLLRLIEQRS